MTEPRLVDNLVLDALYDMMTDQDKKIGQIKSAIWQYFSQKDKFEKEGKNYVNYSKMKEAEKTLRNLGGLSDE